MKKTVSEKSEKISMNSHV